MAGAEVALTSGAFAVLGALLALAGVIYSQRNQASIAERNAAAQRALAADAARRAYLERQMSGVLGEVSRHYAVYRHRKLLLAAGHADKLSRLDEWYDEEDLKIDYNWLGIVNDRLRAAIQAFEDVDGRLRTEIAKQHAEPESAWFPVLWDQHRPEIRKAAAEVQREAVDFLYPIQTQPIKRGSGS